jgi:hypothetical protein
MFYAISKDGVLYFDEILTDLPTGDSIICYLRRSPKPCYEHITQFGNCYCWYKYEFIDRNGNPVNLKMGTCEVTFIHKDVGSYYLKDRQFTIRDQYSREGVFSISGEAIEGDCLRKTATELIPFMRKLSSEGGWDAYWSKYHPDSPNSERIVYSIDSF